MRLVVIFLPVNFNKIRFKITMGANETETEKATVKPVNYRFTGHDTFHCRYAWLPKTVRLLDNDRKLFSGNGDQAMVEIGVGKNMVQSIQFWAEATGIIEPDPVSKGWRPSNFGKLLLQKHDPYLENEETLWLLHWKISTNSGAAFCLGFFCLTIGTAWTLVKTEVIEAFQKEVLRQERKLSASTLETHFKFSSIHIFRHAAGRAKFWRTIWIARWLNCDCCIAPVTGFQGTEHAESRHIPTALTKNRKFQTNFSFIASMIFGIPRNPAHGISWIFALAWRAVRGRFSRSMRSPFVNRLERIN